MEEIANIFETQHLAAFDGPGTRTVIYFKGCPLDCVWCHNPEGKTSKTQVFFDEKRCSSCRLCESICTHNCHLFDSNQHLINRDNCSQCGECTKYCLSHALELCGNKISVEQLIETVLVDKPFYSDGGGVTLSGGEPLAQFKFVKTFLKRLKDEGIHTAIETSGFTTCDVSEIHPYTDLWLYDIKLLDNDEHKKYTGVSNKNILKNLKLLDSLNAKIVLRCPIIPDINFKESHFIGIVELANSLKNVAEINFEPYHPLGISKAHQLDLQITYNNQKFLSASDLEKYVELVRKKTSTIIKIM